MVMVLAPSNAAANNAASEFAWAFPELDKAIAEVRRGGLGWTYEVRVGPLRSSAKDVCLTRGNTGQLELVVTWADGSEQQLPAWEVEELQAVEPQLPACSGFVGAGQRCSSCRIRKAVHS